MLALSMLVAVFLQTAPGCEPDCVVQAAHTETRIRVDGVLDEPVWERAGFAGDFLQYGPDEGAPATLNTQVYLLHDARTLFIGAKLADPEPKRIRRTLGRRDEFTPGDWFVASLDTYDDRKTSFNFAVNAAGVRVEGMGVDAMLPDGSGRPIFFCVGGLWFRSVLGRGVVGRRARGQQRVDGGVGDPAFFPGNRPSRSERGGD